MDGDRLLRAGQLSAAALKYAEVLAIDSDQFHALNSLGLIALERNQLTEAVGYLERACAIRPADSTPRINLGNALARGGRFGDAVTAYDAALRLTPGDVEILCNRSNALFYGGRAEEAIEGYQRVLRREPDHRNALFNLAAATLELNRYGDCANVCFKLLATQANDIDVLLMLLTALSAARRLDDAAEPMRRAVGAVNAMLAQAGRKRNDLQQKILRLSQLLIDLEEVHAALDLLDRALKTFPDAPGLCLERGRVLVRLMRQSEALECFDHVLEIDGASAEARIERGTTLAQLGQFEAAIADCDRALLSRAAAPGALIELVAFKTFRSECDSHVVAIEALVDEIDTLSRQDQIYVHFAAGKACDDLGRYEDAFPHWLAGNQLKRQSISYDVESDIAFNDEIAANFGREWVTARDDKGCIDASPVFVFGMPRSGTTLVEQLIAAHPEAVAIGETGFVQRAVRQSLQDGGPKSSIERTKALDGETLRRLGESYLAQAGEWAGGSARRMIDKTLANSRYAGLIAAALPNAVMIHVRRNALDNCLACFAKHFVSGNKFTYDLEDLARYRQSHDRLMQHWRDALPSHRFIEVDYEDLVANFAAEAQRIIAFCGLHWTDAVLDFAQVSRAVTTASAFQVRQGLYATSVGRWRNYQRQLAPLDQMLNPSRPCIAAAR